MGLELKNNTWTWSSGEDLEYTNWGVKEPFGNGNRGQMILESDPRHVNIWSGTAGKWNDQENDVISIGGLGHYGIAEIKLEPNTAPTGTPELKGDFIPGEFINVDLSDVVDLDNYEGFTPEYSYEWQISADGETWETQNNRDSYYITAEDEGKQIRANISYIDGYGTEESLTTEAFDISTRIDLSDVNIRRFDPGSLSNINLIDFSTLDPKLYRRFDWSDVDFSELNTLAKEDIQWDRVDYRKAIKSDTGNYIFDAIDWDEVNASKYARKIYRALDWSKLDYAGISEELKEDIDWTKVDFREAKKSNKLRIDAVDWDEINASENAKSIYRNLESKLLDDANGETL